MNIAKSLGIILPLIMIIESLAASIIYLLIRDYRRALYWFCAACITAAVTF